ncbi:unnamed protein product [Rotaria sp. Silwood2]|nr:unnamed protein product [Rotaria sp. Silwood2]CAF4028385.1 unnamed protein product [Rotaria sp. Silwood2]
MIEGSAIDLYSQTIITAGPTYGSYKFNVLQHLSAISPYFESNSNGLSPDPPQDCRVNKAIYLVRHGSIYANTYDYNYTIHPFLQRLKHWSREVNFSQSMEFAFLARWTSPITHCTKQVGKLTKSGSLEAFNLGTQLAYRYPHLLYAKRHSSFKIWASKSDRTQKSARMLLTGLYGSQNTLGQVINISEGKKRGANTLTPKETCPRFQNSWGAPEAHAWLRKYTKPIVVRLNVRNPGFNLSANDVLAMQQLCGYETAIRGSSAFCKIFTPEEWLSFEYYFDIKYYYELSYGNDLSPSLGMPWVVASSDLLNRTTDQDLYISVAHREMPPFILTALGLYNDTNTAGVHIINHTFPLDQINYRRIWKSSEFIPFLGRVALERLDCTSTVYNGSFVRILINSAPKPLPGCTSGPGASCPLEQYMNYVEKRNEQHSAFSKACDVHYQSTTDMLTIYS